MGFEWLVLAVLVVIGIPALVAALLVRSTRRSRAQKLAVFDQLFAAETVNYQLAWGAPPYDAVVAEATRRGYRLVQQTPTGLLTFSR